MDKNIYSPQLFSDAELDPLKPIESGPVQCLGMEFENDEARREYFRDELRRKLPELRQIEGFPIGEDEDIIRLSDPPYYTACPNPWLNDFIQQWEEEKKDLEFEGYRKKDFKVVHPYTSDVSEGKRNPIYDAHSYHTKVPHPAIMRYILYYTQPGDIILDGFCGTGMTGVAASMCANPDNTTSSKIENEFNQMHLPLKWGVRHAVLSDLSPVASLISGNYNSPSSFTNVLDKIESIVNACEDEYKWMYKTSDNISSNCDVNYTVWSDVFNCPDCGSEYVFYDVAVNHDTNEISEQYKCPHCGSLISKKKSLKCFESYYDEPLKKVCNWQKKVPVLINYSSGRSSYDKKPNNADLDIIRRASEIASHFSYVTDRMIDGNEARRNDRQGITNIHQFYFPRTLIVYEYLFRHCNTKEMFFLLNSQLVNISKLNRYRPGKSFPYNPLSGTLYIGSQISEANVFVALKNKLKKMRSAFSLISAKNLTGVSSATNMSIKDNSIDYIFTDPPFGANFFYSELNFIQEGWLKVKTNNSVEAIENEAQNKTKADYQFLMTECLKEYYRVLKPSKWITIEFSNTSASIWNAIQQAIQGAGFVIASVAALDKQQGSFKAITTTTAVKQDLILSCYKPSESLVSEMITSKDKSVHVIDFIEELLQHLPVHVEKEQATTAVLERNPKILYDKLISYYVQKGWPIPIDAADFQKLLRETFMERDGMFFTASQAHEYEQKKKNTTNFISLALIISSESEGIAWLNRKLDNHPMTYQEIQPSWLMDLANPKKGDRLPELLDILEENFIKDEDGYWRKPDPEKAADLEALRLKRMAKEFALYLEQARKPKAKRMKDCRLEVLRYGFKDCYKRKDYEAIIAVGDHIQESLLLEDEILLQYYDSAAERV